MRSRGPWLCTLLPAVLLTGCGYVSEPLPPALRRPTQVVDLAAVERGKKIIVQFTVPKFTTEDLPIRGEPDLDLRIGPAQATFDPNVFEKSSERINDIQRRQPLAYVEVPIAKYTGRTVVLGLRVNGPNGRNAGWSNFVRLSIVPALPMPEGLAAANGPDSIRLSWRAAAPEFRIFRKLVSEPSWTLLANAAQPAYADTNIEYGKTYQYYVQAVQKTDEDKYAESEISDPITFNPADLFPPSVPAGLTAIPAVRSVELVWQRDTDKDLASYSVYRNGEKIANGLTAPAYSDTSARPGVTYQYQVTATDTAGNESAKSAAVSAAIP